MITRRMFRGIIAAASAIAVLGVAASTSSAATTFGADLTLTPDQSTQAYTMTTVTDLGGTAHAGAPVSGILTSVRIKSRGAAGSGVVRILTLSSHPDLTTYNFFNDAPEIPVTVTADATPTGHVTEVLTRRPISAGQRLGFYTNDPVGTILDMYHDFAVSGQGECAYTAGSTAGPGTTQPYSTAACNHNIPMLSGTIEADADGDGFGDDTQDQCPTDATTQGPCPTAGGSSTTPTSASPPQPCAGKTGLPLKRCRCKQKTSKAARKKCLRKVNAAARRD